MADRNDDQVLGSLSDMIVDSVEAAMEISFIPPCDGRMYDPPVITETIESAIRSIV